MRQLASAALLVACSLALTGCGGDDRMGIDAFRAEANAACAEAERRLRQLPPPADSPEGVVAYADGAIPVLEERHERLGGLRPPEEEETPYDALLEEAEAELEALRNLREAAGAEDQEAAAGAASRGRVATVRVNVLAVRLELRDCVRRPPS